MRRAMFPARSIFRSRVFRPGKLPSGKPIVLVCQAGGRSARALQQALGAGVKDICHYAPGTGGWKSRGGSVVG